MIFRNKDIESEKSGCLICDDLINADERPMLKELLENMPIPKRGNIISGTLGTFRIRDLED